MNSALSTRSSLVLRKLPLVGDRQVVASLAPAGGEDPASRLGGHPLEEAVLALARDALGLIRPLRHRRSLPMVAVAPIPIRSRGSQPGTRRPAPTRRARRKQEAGNRLTQKNRCAAPIRAAPSASRQYRRRRR